MVGRVVMPTRLVTIQDVAAAVLFVLRLPTRAHVPELVLYPSQL
jgi:NADP-dependent 3-hydroxy acid dehydrogenase YdfG